MSSDVRDVGEGGTDFNAERVLGCHGVGRFTSREGSHDLLDARAGQTRLPESYVGVHGNAREHFHTGKSNLPHWSRITNNASGHVFYARTFEHRTYRKSTTTRESVVALIARTPATAVVHAVLQAVAAFTIISIDAAWMHRLYGTTTGESRSH